MSRQGLNNRQQAALVQLVQGGTVAVAAKAARVSERSVHRWLRSPGFYRRLEEMQSQVLEQALHKLQGGAGKAVDALIANLDCKNKWVVHAAAVAILANAFKGRELLELSQRIEQLETQLLLKGGRRWQALDQH